METQTSDMSVQSSPAPNTVVIASADRNHPQAAENLVGYSSSHPAIFKTAQLTPIKDLKLLVKDHLVCGAPPVVTDAVSINVLKTLPCCGVL
jgi:hypothetical protein